MGTIAHKSFLVNLFGGARQGVLGVLFACPDERFYVREIARAAGVAVGAVQRELVRLHVAGIATRSVRGNQVYYQANYQCPIFAELVGIVTKTFGVADVLRAGLAPLAGQIEVAFIYGSAARGELRQGSDIDLMIVGDVSFGQVVEAIQPAQERLGREINPTVYPITEFQNKMTEGHHLLTTVMADTKIFLTGDENTLGILTKKQNEASNEG
jgi:uncharacterized protein